MNKTILGLDLGTNSIGWALVEVDTNNIPIGIKAMGSRIIPINSNTRDEFQTGKEISVNKERTTRRTQRKGYDRKQSRKKDLEEILNQLGIMPNEALFNTSMLDLWKMRNDAVNESITSAQLGRILYMLNQKRGYKSARSEQNEGKKDTEYVSEVKGRYAQLNQSTQTVGQYFYKGLLNAANNNEYFKVKDEVYPREAYIEEFEKIINKQKVHHDFLTDEIVNKLKNEIIFYQRKLKSQKNLVGICEFEGFNKKYVDKQSGTEKSTFVGPKVAPKTSPLYQMCKIWENVNNISLKVKNPEGSKYKWSDYYPTIEEKEKIANHLFTNDVLKPEELFKLLDLQKENVFVNKQLKNGLQGNITYSAIHKVIGNSQFLKFDYNISLTNKEAILLDKKTGEIVTELDGQAIDATIEKEPLYQLWHTIYSIKDLEECSNALSKKFNFSKNKAEQLAKLDFNKQAFGNKSNKAMRKILPYLMQGFDYSQASSLAGYNHSNSLTKDENEKRVLKEKLELLKKNSLRQPVVEKILNQMINVVNAIIFNFGKPTEIRIELARELKQSKEERENSDKNNRENNSLNKEVSSRLEELGLPTSKKYIQKYKFIFQTRGELDAKGKVQKLSLKDAKVCNQCIYCGESFNLTEALSGDNFDVDHIIPKSMLFDNSQTNKVLVHRNCNTTKTNTTAYDFMASKGEDTLNEYLTRVDDWHKKGILGYGKMQRLKVSLKEYLERKKTNKQTVTDIKLWENFIDRQLRETAYISRKAREILLEICTNVFTTEGSVTAKLRNYWGWDEVLHNLQFDKYKTLGHTKTAEWTSNHGKNKHSKEEITNWSKRDDHRHHAIDALVVACTKQAFIQRINTLNAQSTRDTMFAEIKDDKQTKFDEGSLLEQYLKAQKPKVFSTSYLEKETDKILISFKAGKKVATKGVRKIKKDGAKVIIQKNILVPRGELHQQYVYGKINVIDKAKKLNYLFQNIDKIINPAIKFLIKERLIEHNNDVKKAMDSLKKNPIYKNNNEILETADCFSEEAVLKYPLQSIALKDVPFIVDEKVKQLISERLNQYGGKEKEAFKTTLWFNEAKQIPIKSVRLYTKLKALKPVKKDVNGKSIGFAIPGNNHHVAIYKNNDGKFSEHVATFWHALERKIHKLPVLINNTAEVWNQVTNNNFPQDFIDNLPPDNCTLQYSLQQNEMYIFGLTHEEFDNAIQEKNKALLSKHLYLVWSIGETQYWFRHHLETKNSDLKKTAGAKESKRYYLFKSVGAFINALPIKVRINLLGEISKNSE
jgi:CRISPR-associated endonuclease Csn1